ncbi:MAG: hypothetical protein RLY65_1028, partial [Pseudomonadota bacterium]
MAVDLRVKGRRCGQHIGTEKIIALHELTRAAVLQ